MQGVADAQDLAIHFIDFLPCLIFDGEIVTYCDQFLEHAITVGCASMPEYCFLLALSLEHQDLPSMKSLPDRQAWE